MISPRSVDDAFPSNFSFGSPALGAPLDIFFSYDISDAYHASLSPVRMTFFVDDIVFSVPAPFFSS
jgi:hypothetical protein